MLQARDCRADAHNAVRHVGDGVPHLLGGGGIEVPSAAAGDGDALAPERVDHVPDLDTLYAKRDLQLPAGDRVRSAFMILITMVLRDPYKPL